MHCGIISSARRRSSAAGALDAYTTNLWAALALKRLIGSSPDPIQVMNASAVAALIPFNAGGTDIDATALLAHAPTSGEVTAWISQAGAGQSFGTAVQSKAPEIVTGGAYLGDIEFDGTADSLQLSQNFSPIPGVTVFMRGKLRSLVTCVLFEGTPDYNSNNGFVVYYDTSINAIIAATHQFSTGAYASSQFNNAAFSFTTEAVWCFRFDRSQTSGAAQCVMFKNGVKQTRSQAGAGETSPVPTGNFSVTSDVPLFLGSRNGTSLFAPLNIKNFIVYTAALSDSDCAAISALL